jgi:ABC-type phosphate transport system substrate-binding protein
MIRTILVVAALLVASGAVCAADFVVIVSAKNAGTLSETQIRNIFLGRTSTFPDGSRAIPLTLDEGVDARSQFNDVILKKNEAQLRAYWVERILTGKGLPPRTVATEEELQELVARNSGFIGFVSKKTRDDVRVVPLDAGTAQ